MLRLATALAALLIASTALAQTGTATLSWTAPTQRTDGSTLAAGELTNYVISWGQCAGTSPNWTMPASVTTATVAASVTTYTATGLTTGWTNPHCFVVASVSVSGTGPASTPPVTKLIEAPAKAPTAVTVK